MKLKAWERLYYQNTMNEIFELFEVDDFVNDTSLNGLYLLGFHNQAYAFQMKKDRAEEEEK